MPRGRRARSPANEIEAENCLPGTSPGIWDIPGAGRLRIQGYATDISVNLGQRVNFKVNTIASDYRLDIYRMGYYGGLGARKVTTVQPSVAPADRSRTAPRARRRGSSTAATGRSRRTGTCPPTRSRGSTSRISSARTGRPARATSSSSCGTTTGAPTSCSRRRTRPGRPTTSTAAPRLYTGGPGAQGGAYKVSYNRPFDDARQRGRGLGLQRRVPDGPVARAQRLRRLLLHERRQRPARPGDPRASRVPLGRPRRVLVRPASARTSRRRATRASTSRSSAATRCSGRRAGRTATGRSSPTRRRTRTRRSTPSGRLDGHLARPALRPASDGGRPENALTGQLFTVNAAPRPPSRCRPPTARCGSGATRASRAWRRPDRHAARAARSATSGTRTSTTATGRPARSASRRRP